MSVFICDKDTLAVLDKYLAGFYLTNKVNFQNYFANKLIKWFIFEAVQNTRSKCFIWYPIKHCSSFFKLYL